MSAASRRRAVGAVAVALTAAAVWVLAAPGRVVPTVGVATPTVAPASGAGASPGGTAGGTALGVADGATDAPPDGPADLRVVELRGGWRTGEDLGTAVAVAVLVAAAEGPVVAVEAVEQPGPGAAVVTLLLAERRAGRAEGPSDRTTRLVVPVRLDGGAVRPAGAPWRLDGPSLASDPPVGRRVADPDLLAAARAALAGAGLDPASLRGLDATDGWPFVVRTTADAEDAPASGPWLRWHLDRFVVTGLPLQPAAGSGRGTGTPEGGAGHGAGTRGPDGVGP